MIEALGAILAAMLGSTLFKKKPYCLWVKAGGAWSNTNPAGNSFRRCRKAAAAIMAQGIPSGLIMIIAKGITPPKEG